MLNGFRLLTQSMCSDDSDMIFKQSSQLLQCDDEQWKNKMCLVRSCKLAQIKNFVVRFKVCGTDGGGVLFIV